MRPHQLRQGFVAHLAARDQRVESLTLAQGVDAMLDFYRTARVDGNPLDEDGDMLLYEWFERKGALHVSLVRQAMRGDADATIWQLDLCFAFDAAPAGLQITNQWCHTPGEIEALEQFIRTSAAYRFGVQRSARVTLRRRRVN